MNLENVEDKIEDLMDNYLDAYTVADSVRNSSVSPTWRSVYSFVMDPVWNSVGGGLQIPIRQERKRG